MTLWQCNRETGGRQEDVAPANAIDWLQRARSFEAMADRRAVQHQRQHSPAASPDI